VAANRDPADHGRYPTVAWARRSRQELRELGDHMLKDIGLRREEIGTEFRTPFWSRD
jgi:uncharacterized protein YjiS (DUF1127 family)